MCAYGNGSEFGSTSKFEFLRLPAPPPLPSPSIHPSTILEDWILFTIAVVIIMCVCVCFYEVQKRRGKSLAFRPQGGLSPDSPTSQFGRNLEH